MSKVLARNNGDSYDVLVQNATKEETTALREAFSTINANRQYAQDVQGSLLDAFRSNSIMKDLHEDYKANVRDVNKTDSNPDGEMDNEESDEFMDFVA